jgi:hypothetical protein
MEIEKRTQIPDEPRIGPGHPNIDPGILDPIPKETNQESNTDQ